MWPLQSSDSSSECADVALTPVRAEGGCVKGHRGVLMSCPLICQLTAVSCGCESHRESKTACLKLLPFCGSSCAKLTQMCSFVGDELVQCRQIGVSQCLLKQLSGCLAPKLYLPLVRKSAEVSAYVCGLILLGTTTGTTAAATRREWECPSLEDLYCNNFTL